MTVSIRITRWTGWTASSASRPCLTLRHPGRLLSCLATSLRSTPRHGRRPTSPRTTTTSRTWPRTASFPFSTLATIRTTTWNRSSRRSSRRICRSIRSATSFTSRRSTTCSLRPCTRSAAGACIAMRLLSVLLGAGIVLLAYGVARAAAARRARVALGPRPDRRVLPQHLATVSQVGNDVAGRTAGGAVSCLGRSRRPVGHAAQPGATSASRSCSGCCLAWFWSARRRPTSSSRWPRWRHVWRWVREKASAGAIPAKPRPSCSLPRRACAALVRARHLRLRLA